ncbi:MAG: hypothetical protein LC689_00620 [Myxococcales bacterium]|nr:hypothetical protein [Myxococcales bacterium]
MRLWWAGAAAIVIGCGGHDQTPPSQNKGPPAVEQVTLAITTSGDGAVHGDVDCRGACTQRFAKGSKVALQAVADSGAKFAGWGGACSGDSCALTLDADTAVTATFTRPPPPPPTHRLSVFVDGHGSVRSAPSGIDCGATCAASFDEGSRVGLTPVPDTGYAFSGWGGACNGAGGCVVTMTGDANVSAKFDALPPQMFSVTLSVSGPGKITGNGFDCPGSVCSMQIAAGTTLALTPMPNADARFMGWSGCSGSCNLTVTQNLSIGARFENEVLALAPSDGTNEIFLAINSTQVFYWRYGNGIWGIWSVPKSGGTASLVSSACCANKMFVADDSYVYWSDWSGIYRAPASGGASQRLFTRSSVNAIAVDGDRLFWTEMPYYAGGVGAVYSGSTSGGAVMQLTSANPTGGLAVDSQNVYWTDQHEIGRVSRAGGASQFPIQCGGCVPWVVRLDFDTIYYRNLDGDTWARGKAGGDFHQLNTGNPRSNNLTHVDLDVNAKVGYWPWNDFTGNSRNGLFKANADGSGWTAIQTSSDALWYSVRVDDNYIFYIHTGGLYRRLK